MNVLPLLLVAALNQTPTNPNPYVSKVNLDALFQRIVTAIVTDDRFRGRQGASGAIGPQGPQGPSGPTGPAGQAGKDAKIDYDLLADKVAERLRGRMELRQQYVPGYDPRLTSSKSLPQPTHPLYEEWRLFMLKRSLESELGDTDSSLKALERQKSLLERRQEIARRTLDDLNNPER